MKNKIKLAISGLFVFVLTIPTTIFAASGDLLNIDAGGNTGLATSSLYEIIQTAMQWLLGAVGLFGVIAFAISGIMYLTAAGDDDRIKTAKSVMTSAIIGILVAMVGLVALTAARALLGGTQQTIV